MKLSTEQLDHIVFLSEVVLEANKRRLMPDTIRCLLYIVKSLKSADVLDEPAQEIFALIERIEQELVEENERLQEISGNLSAAYSNRRKPLG